MSARRLERAQREADDRFYARLGAALAVQRGDRTRGAWQRGRLRVMRAVPVGKGVTLWKARQAGGSRSVTFLASNLNTTC